MRWPQMSSTNMLKFFLSSRMRCLWAKSYALSVGVQQFESNRHMLWVVVFRLARCDNHVWVHGDRQVAMFCMLRCKEVRHVIAL